ncbi:hypothetical protein CPB85DRAFT_1374657 [Mucidula mucida]|nr:hypothetical protein CPB85DRAFT_1374657 [Mucidula mucida]
MDVRELSFDADSFDVAIDKGTMDAMMTAKGDVWVVTTKRSRHESLLNLITEHRNPEGRTYWFNTGTKQSVWEKPDELKTPFERALNETKWKEYFSGGRKYYYNTETKESKWDMPDELVLVMEKVEKEGLAAVQTPTAQGAITAPPSSDATPTNGNELAVGPHNGGLPLAASSILPARPNMPDDPVIPHNGFATVEEGEKAFTHLLRKAGVAPDWTWEKTMRAIITDPLYKALNSLSEKKAVFEKYTLSLVNKEKEEREARLAKLRPALRNMLKGNPNVFHYTTFSTADKLFSQHPIWQTARIESERRLIFEEYVEGLKAREAQERTAARTRATAKVVSLFKQLGVDAVTRWRTAYNLIIDSDEWKSDPEIQKLPPLDILLAFEDYSRVKEREFDDQMRKEQVENTRKQRKAREAFKELLQELVDGGKLKARTKWKQVYPLFSKDERYLNMLGNPGSNQLELFWDLVDGFDQKLDAKIATLEDALKARDEAFEVKADTSEDTFIQVVSSLEHSSVKELSKDDLVDIYNTLRETALKKVADERRRAERKLRHLQDDFRYALKKLPEPIDYNMTYEAALPLMDHLPEFKAIEDEEARRTAFAKFVKRQKERQREHAASEDGSTTSRKRKEPVRDDYDRDRERDRDRGKDYDKRHRDHYRHDDYDRRSSKEYPRDERDRDRDSRSARHDSDRRHRERERDRGRDRSKGEYTVRDKDEPEGGEKRARDKESDSVDGRTEKKPRLERDVAKDKESSSGREQRQEREETPEEGEI